MGLLQLELGIENFDETILTVCQNALLLGEKQARDRFFVSLLQGVHTESVQTLERRRHA